MPVTLARHSGYCAGVRKAMDMAEAAAKDASLAGERIYALGDVIHNRLAVERLEKLGETYHVTFVLSISRDAHALPESVQKDVILAL